jgi:putative endonuclease
MRPKSQSDKSTPGRPTTKALGDAAESRALRFLQTQGLTVVQRNYRTPGRGGGEIDLVMRDADGTLVFVEVRQRSQSQFGGALASITPAKQRRIVWAARHFIARMPSVPPCRFDVVVLEPEAPPEWIRAAFDASQ